MIRRVVQLSVFALVLALTAAGSLAQRPSAESDIQHAKSLSRAFQTVAKSAEPAVVHITQFSKVQRVRRDMFGFSAPVGDPVLTQTGLGSGFIVSPDGYVMTNNHVIRNADELKVRLIDGREYAARVMGRDELTDLAVLKIEASGLPSVKFSDSDDLEVGEWVVAIGSPFGLSSSVTAGIVSAKGRTGLGMDGRSAEGFQDFIQTDAAINPGNSGGPLLDLEGKVVGINSAIASRSGGYQGIGFAIPANIARSVMDSILKNGRVVRGYLGFLAEDLSAAEARAEGLGDRPVVRVSSVSPGSPAAKAGLRRGDVLTRLQSRDVDDWNRFRTAVAYTPPGTQVALEVDRGGKTQTLLATVVDREEARAATNAEVFIDRLGIGIRSLTKSEAAELGFRTQAGVLVTGVAADGRAAKAGLRVNDVLVEMDGDTIDSAQELARSAEGVNLLRGSRLFVIRGNQRGYIDIIDR